MSPNSIEQLLANIIKISKSALSEENFDKTCSIICDQTSTVLSSDRILLINNQNGKVIKVNNGINPPDKNSLGQIISFINKKNSNNYKPFLVKELADKPKHLIDIINSKNQTDILWLPLKTTTQTNKKSLHYSLWLERWNGKAWAESDIELAKHLTPFYAQALRPQQKKLSPFRLKFLIPIIIILFILVSFFIPYTSTFSAPVQIIAKDPSYISSPITGIVKKVWIRSGQIVKKNDKLVEFDTNIIDQKINESKKKVEVAMAEIIRLEGESFNNPEALSKLPIQKIEIKKVQSELDFYHSLRLKSVIYANQNGVAIINDLDRIVGAYVQKGEMLLKIADPKRTKISIMTPVRDSGLLHMDAHVSIRLDSRPFESHNAKVTQISFDVIISEDNIPAIKTEAEWNHSPQNILPGQRGMARITGPKTNLGLQLFRKPIIAFRDLTGI